jgi:hypothetical protein
MRDLKMVLAIVLLQRWSACSLQRFASDKWIPCRLVA